MTTSAYNPRRRTRRCIQRRVSFLFKFRLPFPPWMSFYVLQEMNIPDIESRVKMDHQYYVVGYNEDQISVFVNHPAICTLCDSLLGYATNSGVAYKSAKLWFWLLPVLSIFSFFVLGPFALIVLIIAIGISIFKIGADVRARAFDCIVEASLVSPDVYYSLTRVTGPDVLILTFR